jgi:hypothetical protein
MPTVIPHFPYLRLEILPLPPVTFLQILIHSLENMTTEATTNSGGLYIGTIQHKWNPGPYWAVCNIYATYPVLLTAFTVRYTTAGKAKNRIFPCAAPPMAE